MYIRDWQALAAGRLDALAAPSQERMRLYLAAYLLDANAPVPADDAAALLRTRGWRIDANTILSEPAFAEVFRIASEAKNNQNDAGGEVASNQKLLELDRAFFEIPEASEMRSAPELLKKVCTYMQRISSVLFQDE